MIEFKVEMSSILNLLLGLLRRDVIR